MQFGFGAQTIIICFSGQSYCFVLGGYKYQTMLYRLHLSDKVQLENSVYMKTCFKSLHVLVYSLETVLWPTPLEGSKVGSVFLYPLSLHVKTNQALCLGCGLETPTKKRSTNSSPPGRWPHKSLCTPVTMYPSARGIVSAGIIDS